jgi:hypothetical protein
MATTILRCACRDFPQNLIGRHLWLVTSAVNRFVFPDLLKGLSSCPHCPLWYDNREDDGSIDEYFDAELKNRKRQGLAQEIILSRSRVNSTTVYIKYRILEPSKTVGIIGITHSGELRRNPNVMTLWLTCRWTYSWINSAWD